MLDTFKFVTDNDQEKLFANAKRVAYGPNQIIVKEGEQRQTLYFVVKGRVRVERDHLGKGIAYAQMGEGQVFGEMSLLEDSHASASVVADDDVEVLTLHGDDVASALQRDSALAERFYHSLAVILSQRLRETAAKIPPLMVEDVAQVERFHKQRTGMEGQDRLPQGIIDAVKSFGAEMRALDRAIEDEELPTDDVQIRVLAACDAMHNMLCEQVHEHPEIEGAIGSYAFRETFPRFMRSRFCDRSYTKPRGYSGDFETIELIYRNEPRGDGTLGPFIDQWFLSQPAAQAVRNRRGMLTREMHKLVVDWGASSRAPMPVTSLASGPARELFDLFASSHPPRIQATCIDVDHKALKYAAAIAAELGAKRQFTFATDNVFRLIKGGGQTKLTPQYMIYSIGLCDYLSDRVVVELLSWMFDMLLPGGSAVIGNFVTANPNKPFMDHILEWKLNHRSADDIRALFEKSKFRSLPVDIKIEDAGVNLFAFCSKVG